MNRYIIYAKQKGATRSQALDLGSGSFVTKLIYATLLEEAEVDRVLTKLRAKNPDYIFEARPAGAPSSQTTF